MSTCFNLRKGSEILDEQCYPRHHIVLSGGLAKTPECGQIIADVFDSPVLVLKGSDEGSGCGGCLMAAFVFHTNTADPNMREDWTSFLESRFRAGPAPLKFDPDPSHTAAVNNMYSRYKKLLQLVPQLTDVTRIVPAE